MKFFYNKPVETISFLMETVFIHGHDTNSDHRDRYVQAAYSFRQLAPDFKALGSLLTADEVKDTVELYFHEDNWYTYIDTAWHLINGLISASCDFCEAKYLVDILRDINAELVNWMDEWLDAHVA